MSNGLSKRELKEMQDAVSGLYPDVAQILSVTSTADGQGGFTEAWGTLTRNVPCRIDALVGSERQTDGSLRAFTTLEVTFAFDVTVSEANRIEVGDNVYHVTYVAPDQSWAVEKTAQVERIS